MRDITVEQINQICIDFRRMKAPQPLSLIAQLNGVTVETVRRVLTAQGYPVAARRTRIDEGISAQIREMAGQGLTWGQAAERLGLSVERTKNAARQIGLDGPEDFIRTPRVEDSVKRANNRERKRRWAEQKRRRLLEEEMRACGLLKE